jgi:hypothetical protein
MVWYLVDMSSDCGIVQATGTESQQESSRRRIDNGRVLEEEEAVEQ